MTKRKETAIERKREKEIKKCLSDDTRGLSTVEYLILLVVIAVAGITVWKKVGGTVTSKAETANTDLSGL